jgi:IclR family acetate operon transcriptional repressor
MTTNKPYPGTQSVIRAISLLKAFTDEHSEWRLTELAQEVSINKTTAFRLLTALESEGLVTRDPASNAYRLGFGIVTMAGQALRSNEVRSLSHPELVALASSTQETATLEVLSGSETLILDEVAGKHVMSGTQSVGTRWPAYATSTGKAILASMTAEEIRKRLPENMMALTPNTFSSLEMLNHDLERTRARGYAVANEELEMGLIAVAAVVRNYDGEAIAAISLSGPAIRLTPDQIPKVGLMVCDKARQVSVKLGCRPV